jgi:hypothetical protein
MHLLVEKCCSFKDLAQIPARTLSFDNFKPWLKIGSFKCTSWLKNVVVANWTWCQNAIGGIYFTKTRKAETLQPCVKGVFAWKSSKDSLQSCVTIANPDLLSSSEAGVNPAVRSWKKHSSEWAWCQKAIGEIYFTKKWRAEHLQPGLEFDNIKPRLKSGTFKSISWLNSLLIGGRWAKTSVLSSLEIEQRRLFRIRSKSSEHFSFVFAQNWAKTSVSSSLEIERSWLLHEESQLRSNSSEVQTRQSRSSACQRPANRESQTFEPTRSSTDRSSRPRPRVLRSIVAKTLVAWASGDAVDSDGGCTFFSMALTVIRPAKWRPL